MYLNMEFRKGIMFLRINNIFDYEIEKNIKSLVEDLGIKFFVLNIIELNKMNINNLNVIFDCYQFINKYDGKLYICEDKNSTFINIFKNKIPIINSEIEIFNLI